MVVFMLLTIDYCSLSFPSPPSPHHTHTTYRPSPIVCPSNVSQNGGGYTALAIAIEMDKEYGIEGCKECMAVLRAAGAEE
jgi:hypothetical protein